MRYQGRISDWKDEKGFGFVTPNGGGERAFVHINAFVRRGARPAEGDQISYDVGLDDRRRPQARRIRFAGDVQSGRPPGARPASRGLSIGLAAGACVGIVGFNLAGLLPIQFPFAFAGMSLIAFVMYAFDKSAALKRSQRTPEITLHLVSLLGGWPGALVAQQVFRHKTVKGEFRVLFWATVVINCAALGWLILSDRGAGILQAF